MKTIFKLSLFVFAALAAACAPPANTNTNTNTNTNAAPKAAMPTADTLMAMENKAWEAWKNKDTKYFEGFIADNAVGFEQGRHMTRAEMIKMIGEGNCDVKSFSLSDPHVTPAGADAVAITYKGTADATCDGQKLPANVTAASVYVRSGDTWKAAYHSEVPIIEQAGASGNTNTNSAGNSMAPASNSSASSNTASNSTATTANNSSTAAANSNSNSNSNSNTSSGGDALTSTLMALEKRGWEAWMKQDTKEMEAVTGKDVTFVDATGRVTKGQADTIKRWTDGSCKVSSVNVSDGKASMITKDAAILNYKGTAVGTCGTMKLEPLWGMTVAVKEGETWKAVYIFEVPVRR